MKQHSRWIAVLCLISMALAVSAQSRPPKIIDVHVHYNGEPGVLEKLLDRLNAVDGLAFLLTTPKGFPQASKFIQEHPNRFIGFGDINLDDPSVLQQVDRFHVAGFRGLGEISMTLKNYDDQAYWPIYDRANKYHMILLFHTGIVSRPDPATPANISFDRSRASRLDLITRKQLKLQGGTQTSISTFRVRLSSRKRMIIVSFAPSSGGQGWSAPIPPPAVPALLRNSSSVQMSSVVICRNSTVRWRATTRCWTPLRYHKAHKTIFFQERCRAFCRHSKRRSRHQPDSERNRKC